MVAAVHRRHAAVNHYAAWPAQAHQTRALLLLLHWLLLHWLLLHWLLLHWLLLHWLLPHWLYWLLLHWLLLHWLLLHWLMVSSTVPKLNGIKHSPVML